MKKTYIIPNISVLHIQTERIIAGSGAITSGKGMGYGGVDTDGSIDPSVKRQGGFWDDDDWRE